jgi:hypothetical protein
MLNEELLIVSLMVAKLKKFFFMKMIIGLQKTSTVTWTTTTTISTTAVSASTATTATTSNP